MTVTGTPAPAGAHPAPSGGRRFSTGNIISGVRERIARRRASSPPPQPGSPPTGKGAVVEFIGAVILGVGIFFTTAGLTVFGVPGYLGLAIAHGVVLAVLIITCAESSGAHFNAAVSLGLIFVGESSVVKLVLYTITRTIGFALASLIVSTVYARVHADEPLYVPFYGIAKPADPDMSAWITFWMEALIAFILVLAIASALRSSYGKGLVAAAGGLGLTSAVFISYQITGASANPERNLGPLIMAWWYNADQFVGWYHFWGYMFGPLIGGLAAGLVYKALFARQVETAIAP